MARPDIQERIIFEDNRLVPVLYGEQNAHLHALEDALDIQIKSRGNELTITGDPADTDRARHVLESLWSQLQKGQIIDQHMVTSALRFQDGHPAKGASAANNLPGIDESANVIVTKKKRIAARNPAQASYIQAMSHNNLTFGIGPAGTGKTYLAVAMAVAMLESGKVERIILSRPALEAGERIGFLPGELKEKMDPYMRPLYDSLYDTMAGDKVIKKIASEEIEIAPLAFMRGRTLNNAFIILDESQNTTTSQMMMFLTRLGENSRMVVTGDPTQIDLPPNTASGLREAQSILQNIEDISFTNFSSDDVVRHKLVGKIIRAYESRKK